MIEKYISNETKKQLKTLREYRCKVKNYNPAQARQELLKTGIYNKNGKLKHNYRGTKINKYKNIWTKCNQGHRHQSKKEAMYCNNLFILKKTKNIMDYETQESFDLYCNDILVCKHIVDFLVRDNNGNDEVHEIKSKPTMTVAWKIKKKLFEINFPDIKYIVVDK
jgi:hypothetical protein